MAFPCKLWLKAECDGCGRCDEPGHSYSRIYGMETAEDEDDPFEIDYDDERYE